MRILPCAHPARTLLARKTLTGHAAFYRLSSLAVPAIVRPEIARCTSLTNLAAHPFLVGPVVFRDLVPDVLEKFRHNFRSKLAAK